MATDLITRENTELANVSIGQIANEVAAQHTFTDYRERKAANTLRRQNADLALFADHLAEVGVTVGDLARDPQAWEPVTWGLVASFVKRQLQLGYAVSSVNVRLSTVKTYAKLALSAGALGNTEYALIKAVRGYDRKEAMRIDEARDTTRIGNKKAAHVRITRDQASELKAQPDTPQGRRDSLVMHLLLDLGLRVGELAGLDVTALDVREATLTFYRPKVDKTQTHELRNGTLKAARAYLENDALATGPLLRGSRKDGRLHDAGLSARNITKRVRLLGERVGIDGLSAHDLRHYWATTAATCKTDLFTLQEAGGWKSLAMPRLYTDEARIANAGVRLE